MKIGFFLNKVLMVCAFLCVIGCTQDTGLPENDVINAIKTKKGLRIDETMEVLVEFVEGTPESNKRRIRDNYTSIGLLLDWQLCNIRGTTDVEVWIIDLEVYMAYRPAPLTETENEDMDKVTLYANCKDYTED